MITPRAGGEVDAWCTRCKMVLAHTVLAVEGTKIARVQCNTCKGDHAYKASAPDGKPSTRSSSSSATTRPSTIVTTYEEKIRGRELSGARPYNVKDEYHLNDLLRHPTFGLGIVVEVRGPQKIQVMFPTDEKLLMQNKGGAPPRSSPPRPIAEIPSADEPERPEASASDD